MPGAHHTLARPRPRTEVSHPGNTSCLKVSASAALAWSQEVLATPLSGPQMADSCPHSGLC